MTRISEALQNGAADTYADATDGGTGAGTLEIRTGAAPTNIGDADTGDLLAVLTFSDPAYGDATGGTATANAITDESNAPNSGSAGHFRKKDGDGTPTIDGTAGDTGSEDLVLDDGDIVAGGTVSASSVTITQPAE